MTREQIILAAMAPAKGSAYSPVQLQKLLFLIDQRAAARVGGPHFNFEAYDYGPFDRAVYDELMRMAEKGLVEIKGDPYSKDRRYRLSEAGQTSGETLLNAQDPALRDFLYELSRWVRALSFAQLVSAIYKAYPAMRARSVFAD